MIYGVVQGEAVYTVYLAGVSAKAFRLFRVLRQNWALYTIPSRALYGNG